MRSPRRLLVAVAVMLVAGAATAEPAVADPARPGNVRSRVLAVEPPVPGVELAVVGGDAFLRLTVEPGRTVEVPGYQGEPYLRIAPDGTVEENEASEAVYLNRSRFPLVRVPDGVGPDATPRWRRVGGGGTVTWHDHRIHWMGGGEPPRAVTPWEVALVVDGTPVTARGQYERVASPAAWPWWLVTLVVAALASWALRRRLRAAGVVVAGVAALGLPVAWSVATGAGASGLSVWSGVALLGLAAALGVVAVVLAGRPARAGAAGALVAGAGVALVLWSARRVVVWSSAVLVTSVPAPWDRAATAAALAGGVAAVVAGAWAVLGPVPEPAPSVL